MGRLPVYTHPPPAARPPAFPCYSQPLVEGLPSTDGGHTMPRVVIDRERSNRVSVYMDGVDADDMDEVAGMLRGLACAINGFRVVSDMDNTRFWIESPVKWGFNTTEDADYFRTCVDYYFDDDILKGLKVKPRYRRR